MLLTVMPRGPRSRARPGVKLVIAPFKRAVSEGDLPPDADPAALARFVLTVNSGLSVQAAGGASRTELLQVVQTALQGCQILN